jgi:hypothetical protein
MTIVRHAILNQGIEYDLALTLCNHLSTNTISFPHQIIIYISTRSYTWNMLNRGYTGPQSAPHSRRYGITKVQSYVLNLMYQPCNLIRNISFQYNAITKV